MLDIWGKPFIELADDNTFFNHQWGRSLARLLGEYELKWFTETDISVSEDPALLEALAESGCAQLLIGLESGEKERLKGIDAKNWKYKQFDKYRGKINFIQSFGISVNGCFILGFDEDST